MTLPARPLLLTDLSWMEIEDHLTRDRRLIVPVGACDQYGAHLPLGAGTRLVEALADHLSHDQGVLRAPAIPFGVNLPTERVFPGTATVREKTLHRVLNDLLASWEDHGFEEFIVLTAQSHDPHVEAIATVTGTNARVRVVEVLSLDLSPFLDAPARPQHAGEVLTSLMLYLFPDKVNQERAEDFFPYTGDAGAPHRLARLPTGSSGSLGYPSLATREKGERIFTHLVEKLRQRVFLEPDAGA